MDENSQPETSHESFMSIPDIRFDELWASFPEKLRQSILTNYDAYVMHKDGTRTPLKMYMASRDTGKNMQSE